MDHAAVFIATKKFILGNFVVGNKPRLFQAQDWTLIKKVFVTRNMPGNALAELAKVCEVDVYEGSGAPTSNELAKRAASADALICMITDKVDQALLAVCPNLQAVSTMSVGVDHIDVEALTARNIPLGNTPGVLVDTTADLAFALLMAASRRIVEADNYVRAGNWLQQTKWAPDMFLGKDISGATLGIIGLGKIGCAVARRGAGFNMRVVGWTQSEREVDGIESLSFDEVLRQSDFVSINVALLDATKNLIDARALSLMKADAILINTARGGIVDEQALADSLANNKLAAAGFDVFASEPIDSDNPLLQLSNVVVAPHIGSASTATRSKMASLAVANILAVINNMPMPCCVNSARA
jgi:glyoxylate reductase